MKEKIIPTIVLMVICVLVSNICIFAASDLAHEIQNSTMLCSKIGLSLFPTGIGIIIGAILTDYNLK